MWLTCSIDTRWRLYSINIAPPVQVAAIESWELTTSRNINYRSFEPILRLVNGFDTPEVQHWAVWALANLTTGTLCVEDMFALICTALPLDVRLKIVKVKMWKTYTVRTRTHTC